MSLSSVDPRPASLLGGGAPRLGPVLLALLVLTGAAAFFSTTPPAAAGEQAPVPATLANAKAQAWPDEVVDAFARLPVQEGGRVKPLYTWASYALLRANYKRSLKTPEGRTIGPVEWALDAMFRPEVARKYRCFRILTKEVTDALGIDVPGKKKADYYSYDELFSTPGARTALVRAAQQAAGVGPKQRSDIQGAHLALEHSVDDFEGLMHFLDFAHAEVDVSATPALVQRFGGAQKVGFDEVLRETPAIVFAAAKSVAHAQDMEKALRNDAGYQVVEQMRRLTQNTGLLAILPPTLEQSRDIRGFSDRTLQREVEPDEWLTPVGALDRAERIPMLPVASGHLEMLAQLQDMWKDRNDVKATVGHAQRLHALAMELANARGQGGKIDLEVDYYRLDFFGKALPLFLLAFLLVAISWLKPNKWLHAGVWLALGAGALLTVAAIVMRCILRGRPPISNLYETLPVATVLAVVVSMFLERVNHLKIGLSIAPVLGALGLFIAGRYEVSTGQDTMAPLVAVLDTNFWLATHVTCITIGYSASFLTAMVGHVYVFGKVFRLWRDRPGMYVSLSRILYGMLAFALIFSTVGTILGGIWANESWGRFWGWDPKENGALMIVLWQLAMIHGRLGGYLKPFGMAMASVALGGVVAFSWWGVNLLGIGLHSYGFAKGVWTGLIIYYGIEVAVLITGFVWWLSQQARTAPTSPSV